MIGHADALTQLAQAVIVEHLLEFRLADEHDLHELATFRFKVGKQSDVFEHVARQALGFVDDQHDIVAIAGLFEQIGVELFAKGQLVALGVCVPQFHEDEAKELNFSQSRIENQRRFAVRSQFAQQRTTHGYRLTGFGDMTAADIAHHTWLSTDQAVLAAQRLCSEPFLWHDSEARLQRFREAAADAGLGMTRGGRFWHLMGDTSKARAMHQLREWIDHGRGRSVTVALGDSDNDREMLEQADIAVCVRRHDGTMLDCEGQQRTLRTGQPGPTGWNSAVLEILRDFRPPDR